MKRFLFFDELLNHLIHFGILNNENFLKYRSIFQFQRFEKTSILVNLVNRCVILLIDYLCGEDVIKSSNEDKDALALEVSPSSLYEEETTQETETNKNKSRSNNGNSENYVAFTKIDDYNMRYT